ncbi:cadherin-like beta sandwich domain-containing protein [Cohnella boryungensis]|uniref:Cadherin-like beta sandwich domain-containing protein n=1 Tax=Cohnella boryungensis TaxID=768479 RepID=A0ABV8SE35_9BACL
MTSKRWNSGLAKLLIAALLLQVLPAMQGGKNEAYAEGVDYGEEPYGSSISVTDSTYGPSVTATTYGPNDNLTDYTWERMTAGTFKPAARQAAAMTYDENEENVVLFGGEGNGGLLDDTWIWTGGDVNTWQEAMNLSTKPAKRAHAAMAYDPVSGGLILFGGQGQSGVLGDTWLWKNGAWTQLTGLAQSPSPRAGAQMAYDGERLVLFGGYTLSGSTKIPNGETWLWNGASWENATPADPGDSPLAAYYGQMSFDGQTAVLYGGITGSVTRNYTADSNQSTKTFTHYVGSDALWLWNGADRKWISKAGPEAYERWGEAMAYDGRRVVFFGGKRDYVHMYTAELVTSLTLPTSTYPAMRGSYVYGWNNGGWEKYPLKYSTGVVYNDVTGYENSAQPNPNITPFPLSDANMAFDGSKFIVFGGYRDKIDVMNKPLDQVVSNWPAGRMNETWAFGYTPPSAPVIEMVGDPIPNFDPQHINDTVSIITKVQSLGGRPVTSRGVEYRPYTEEGNEDWISVPYTADPQATGSFTVMLTGLEWQRKYEARGYAVNAIGTSYTETKPFELKDDPNMEEPDVRYDRVGPSVLNVKDRKRLVAVGEGVTNLLRKPVNLIEYYLQSGGNRYPLKYNILNERQLELTWDADLPQGQYDVVLEHGFYKDYSFAQSLMVTNLDFYKPRDFALVEVPSTSSVNELSALRLQGPFTETPQAPNVYTLNDVSEVVALNDTVLFKGSRLVVDKSNPGHMVITGEGRLFVNGGSQEAAVPYTLYDGSFEFTSNDFSIALNDGRAVDYLGIDMPFTPSKITFAKGGLKLAGTLDLGFTVGSGRVTNAIPVDEVLYRYGRFELTGTYALNKSFKVGPIDVSDTSFVIDSRIPWVSVKGKGSLPGTSLSFDLRMKLKQGRLDEVGFGMFNKANFASTGLQIDYLYGTVDKLAEKTQVPQRLPVFGSVTDILVPQLKHPSASYKFNLLGTDEIDVNLTPYGLDATGIEYYYWLPVNKMSLQAVVNPSNAGIKGFSQPGFLASGEINAYDVIKGTIAAYSFNKKGYNGALKATVYVPKGIPRIGGATIRNAVLSVNEKQIIGMLKHNGIAARVSYTFSNNTILFEVEAEPPKKSWWEKGLDFINNVNDFFEKVEPLGDILEELLYEAPSYSEFNIAAADDWTKSFDFERFNRVAASTGALKKVYDLTPVSLVFQPDEEADTEAVARMVEGKLTTVERKTPMTTQATAAGGQSVSVFRVKHAYEAWIVLTGDQRAASLKQSPAAHPNAESAVKTEAVYNSESDLTFIRASLSEGIAKLTAGTDSRIRMHELLFANRLLKLEQVAEAWTQTPDRPVTSLLVEERGSYAMQIDAVPGEVVVYKPDGRPYYLESADNAPGRNAFRDGEGNTHVLLNAVEAGTWLIGADENPAVRIDRVPAQTTIEELKTWVQSGSYPTVFEMSSSSSGQAVVEIYEADENTKLYRPDGELYELQPNPNKSGMNVSYDEARRKMTVWLDGVELKGQWKAVSGSGFASVIGYKLSRKFKSIKPLLDEGQYSKYFEVAEKGDYLLSVSGGNAHTVILDPAGKAYALNFADPNGNAYVQPASDRTSSPSSGGDPLDRAGIVTPYPADDGRDMLYVTLLNASAGKWRVQNGTRADVQIQKLIPTPDVKVSAAPVEGDSNRVRVTWSTENAAVGTEVTLMLTGSRDAYIGEPLVEGLAASGSTVIDIPEETLPGTYYLSAEAASADEAPVYTIAANAVEVAGAYALAAPATPEVLSAGNGEATLRFASVSGQVERYRIWIGSGAGSEPITPVMDVEPQAGAIQEAVVSGLTANADYTVAVSAIGRQDGRFALSPLSGSVDLTLPAPQPATLSVSLDAGSSLVSTRNVAAYDGSDRTLLITSAGSAKLKAATNQAVTLALTIDGQTFGSVQAPANGVHSFDLNALLNVGALEEREYKVRIEAVNARGDRSSESIGLFVDRTNPLLIASGWDDQANAPIPLNGAVDGSGKLRIVGQTEIGAKLEIDGIVVPLDDEGRFVYYAPLVWDNGKDRQSITMKASDGAGNTTDYGFEVVKDTASTGATFPGDLAALTVGGASLVEPYIFDTVSYQAKANSNKVRVYAVPMEASSTVTIDGQTLPASGYVEVDVTAAGQTAQVRVRPAGNGPEKTYAVQIGAGSSVPLLSELTLRTQSGQAIAAAPFVGTDDSYEVYVDYSTEGVTLTPGALMAGSAITVDGQNAQNGQASQIVALEAGENRIPVIVSSPDGSQSRSYEVVVLREKSGNAELQQLGIQTSGAVLTPEFDPNVFSYQVKVPQTTTAFVLKPVAQQLDATVLVNGQSITGSPATIPFGGDGLTVKIEMSAQDGSTRTYTLYVLRQKASPEAPPLLDSLEASAALDGSFNPYKLNYGTKLRVEGGSVSIQATANDPQATVTVMDKSLQGGGSFTYGLKMGLNTIKIQVESADQIASQTYSIDVTRVSAGSAPMETVRQSTVTGGSGDWTVQIPIIRTIAPDGSVIDTVKLDADKAKAVLDKARQSKNSVARILVTDLPGEPADERKVDLNPGALTLLAESGLTLRIELPEGVIELRTDSLKQLGEQGKDVYFRIVPIVAANKRDEVVARALQAESVRQAADGRPVSAIGGPVRIETNYTNYKTGLLFRLDGLKLPADEAAAKRMLSELTVYIEHSDGEKKLAQGEIRYDEDGGIAGLAIEVDKFSTFTVLRMGSNETATPTKLEPYLLGYADGTFRPLQSIKRSEIATILHRLGLDGADKETAAGGTTGYKDVKASHWAAEAIASVRRSGLMLGDDKGLFRPDASITRAELASIIARLLPSGATGRSELPTDVQGHWAAGAIGKALEAGILKGYPNGTFQPDRQLSRAEAVRVLNQLLERPTASVSSSGWPDVPANYWAIRDIESATGTVTVSESGAVRIEPYRKNESSK